MMLVNFLTFKLFEFICFLIVKKADSKTDYIDFIVCFQKLILYNFYILVKLECSVLKRKPNKTLKGNQPYPPKNYFLML